MKSLFISCVILLTLTSAAFAAPNGRPIDRPKFGDQWSDNESQRKIQELERRLADLNGRLVQVERESSQIRSIEHRISKLESLVGGIVYPPSPPPRPVEVLHVCSVVDSGYSDTFLGTGRTQTDAEYQARSVCQAKHHASYCTAGKLSCDSTINAPYAQGFVCVITDSGYSVTYRAEGRTAVEATAKARQQCQGKVHGSYCGAVPAKCEAF